MAFLSLFGGATVLVIFCFTRPPAVDELSGDSIGIIAVLVTINLFGVGCREIRNIFLPKSDSESVVLAPTTADPVGEIVNSAGR